MEEGWIKLHRTLIKWEWYDDIPVKVLFIHFLITVNHADGNYRGRKILRGQRWTSIGHIATETGLSVKQVRDSIEKLQTTGEIKTQGASNGTMVTVCKYDTYQEIQKPKGKQTGEPKANEGQAEGQTKGNKQEGNNNSLERIEGKELQSEKRPIIYFVDQLLNELYHSYLKMRVQKGAKATDTTIQTQIKKFNLLPIEQVEWALNQSIENGWTGVFVEKYKPKIPDKDNLDPEIYYPDGRIKRPWHEWTDETALNNQNGNA